MLLPAIVPVGFGKPGFYKQSVLKIPSRIQDIIPQTNSSSETMMMNRTRQSSLMIARTWQRNHRRQHYSNHHNHNHRHGWTRFSFQVAAATSIVHAVDCTFGGTTTAAAATTRQALFSSFSSQSSSSSSATITTQAEPNNSKRPGDQQQQASRSSKDDRRGEGASEIFDLSETLKGYGKSTDDFVRTLFSGSNNTQDETGRPPADDDDDDEKDLVSGNKDDNKSSSTATLGIFDSIKNAIDDAVEAGKNMEKTIESIIEDTNPLSGRQQDSSSSSGSRQGTSDAAASAESPEQSYQNGIRSLLKFMSKIPSSNDQSVDEIIAQTRDSMASSKKKKSKDGENIGGSDEVSDETASAKEILDVAMRAKTMLESRLTEFFGTDGPPPLSLTGLVYYLEAEGGFPRKLCHLSMNLIAKSYRKVNDSISLTLKHAQTVLISLILSNIDERKNPSWKRRKHMFFPWIDIAMMDDLYTKMTLAKLGYAETVEEIQQSLAENYNSELVYATVESNPNKPSHFIAVPRDQSSWSPYLEVMVVVCGTKSMSDVLSDLMCDEGEYRGGLAHIGITEAGKWLVDKHTPLLERLLKITNKRRIKLTLIGHSLGAGTASIAAMEWNDRNDIQVQCTGFGCPALLSEDLCKKSESFITTVVADSDCVPRMSLATMVNGLMDVTELNWTEFAKRDFEETVDEMQRFLPSLVNDSIKQDILEKFTSIMPDKSSFKSPEEKRRMTPVLFPPGKIIHFFNDGYGVTGSVVPATFFSELDITRRMLDDHFMKQGYEQIFLSLMRQYHGDNLYSFKREGKP